MKKLFSLLAVSVVAMSSLTPTLLFAQSNDEVVKDLLATSADWWYAASDKNLVKVISKTSTTATIEAPVAKRNGQTVSSYYITWAPLSYEQIVTNTNLDDLAKVKDSDKAALNAGGTPIYKVEGDKLVFTIDIAEPTKDIYVTIEPEDENRNTGNAIKDFTFNLSTVKIGATGTTTAVAGDVYDTSLNQAITNVSCVWDATANRTTLLWDINTALSATTVEISHRPDENQGNMTVKGTPNVTDRRFVVDTPHRDVQLFRLKPLDGNKAMVGNEIQYICKPDTPSDKCTIDGKTNLDKNDPNCKADTPVTPTNPSKPIPVTPATGPVETAAIVLIISILGYAVYRKVRKA